MFWFSRLWNVDTACRTWLHDVWILKINTYRLAEMSPLICFSLVPYARQGHGLGKRPCKLSSLLFCLQLACRSAKAQALCQCQICHLMMKKRTSRSAGPLERTLSAGFTGKVSVARCASVLLLGKAPVCPTVSFFCYFCVARTGTKGRDLRRVLTGMLWEEESRDKVLCIYWKQGFVWPGPRRS